MLECPASPASSSSSLRAPRKGRGRDRRRAAAALSARGRRFERVEVARLRAHFRAVIRELAHRDLAHLTPSQRAARAFLIAELARYARRGRFPRNLDFTGRTPYFIDAVGTRCAMAHLIEHTGAAAFVSRIAAQQNNAYIADIEHDPELVAWLAQAGLTAAEAARIQPSYPRACNHTMADLCVCHAVTTSDGPALEAIVTETDGELMQAEVTAVHWRPGTPFDPEAAANIKVGMTITAFSRTDAAVGDTLVVLHHETSYSADEGIGPALIFKDGVAELDCSYDAPELTTEAAVAALMASNMCSETLAEQDAHWAEIRCTGGGCAMAPGSSASLALPGVLGLATLTWASRRRRCRRRPPRRS